MKINLKVPSKKENENNERKKEKFVKSDVGSNVLEETEEKIVF